MRVRNTPEKPSKNAIEIAIRVGYGETDQMGVVHHANYFRYFEVARMTHFRSHGFPYGDLERGQIFFMILEMHCKCRSPAYFDDVIHVKTWIHRMTRFRIVHHYEIRKQNKQIVATRKTVLASVSEEGFPIPLPESLRRNMVKQ